MNKALADLIKISNATGKDSALVQGGGGNTSVKTPDGEYMYIKASGTALKDMSEDKGWRRLKIASVLNILADKELAKLADGPREVEVVNRLLLSCDDDVTSGARPSVEAHLHAMLDNHVIHLHPIAVGAYVNARNGKAMLEELFEGEKLPALWVPYTDPGLMLALKIKSLIEKYQDQYGAKPQVLFLEKHGIFVTESDANSALKLVNKVIGLCESKLKKSKTTKKIKKVYNEKVTDALLAIRKAVFVSTGNYLPVTFVETDNVIASFMARKDAKQLLGKPALNPDELVYSNGPAMWLDDCKAEKIAAKLNKQIEKSQKPSAAFLVKGVGLFIAAEKKMSGTIAEIAKGSFMIRSYAQDFGGVTTLSKKQQDFVNNWEAEAFRKKLAAGAGDGMLKNRIAVVTGAGSGLGRSIAIGLARAGAIVGLADIDTKAAQETKELITAEIPTAQAEPMGCNVTDEENVRAAFEGLMNEFGGIDIMVNAAGVAPAAPLVDMPVDKWRFALEVNLTGYFLMAREAARIMIKQGMGGSIVNISSKSGIDASKNNTPYNATKAGELHIARGWAMELGQFGIRVNCVCPGNVFEGSKIWNPTYIRECAKKYGIKPEEVIPYYVDKTALKIEIKGQDIADAVVFLSGDKSRVVTGQTLVVDAGQAMVR